MEDIFQDSVSGAPQRCPPGYPGSSKR